MFGLRITGESVVDYACNIMLLCARLIKNTNLVEVEIPGQLKSKEYKNINRLKKTNADAYKKAVSALKLLELA